MGNVKVACGRDGGVIGQHGRCECCACIFIFHVLWLCAPVIGQVGVKQVRCEVKSEPKSEP
jgi:hypothetical protein